MRSGRPWRGSVVVALVVLGGGAAPAVAQGDDTVVRTGTGLVRGAAEGGARAFLGVPYATPPVGELRWRAPQAPAPWGGIRDATAAGSACPAHPLPPFIGIGAREGSTDEDCLVLNVYAPRPARTGLPVIVWLHGGAFVTGAGTDVDGRVLSAKGGVVVVTVNYRLGPFGFLALPGLTAESPDATSGNLGLVDQRAALEWVQQNIAAFGGDPDRVTLSGQSAGAGSVCAHLVSPGSAGLFQRAVVQSSSCTSRRVDLATAEAGGAEIAARAGCADPAAQVACLRGKSTQEILDAGGNDLFATSFAPNVDGVVVPQQVPDAIAAGAFTRVPVMQGITHDEFGFHVASLFALSGNPLTEAQYPGVVEAQFGADAAAVLEHYPAGAYPTPADALTAAGTDARYACSMRVADRLLAGHVPTYAYEFNDPNGPPFILTEPVAGAIHGADLPYVFQPVDAGGFAPDQLALSDELIGYWSRFAATGDPNGRRAPRWPVYSVAGDRFQSLEPGGSRSITTYAADHRCDFWGSIGG